MGTEKQGACGSTRHRETDSKNMLEMFQNGIFE